MLTNTSLMALQDHGYLFLAIGAIMLGLLFRAYVATTLDSFPRELSLIREKPNSKHFSIKTRLAFYLHCSSLYRDIWDKVRPYSHPSKHFDMVPAAKLIRHVHFSGSSPKKAFRCSYPHSASERTFSFHLAL